MITILYFAWLREHTGFAHEDIKISNNIQTVGDIVGYLKLQSDGHARALGDMEAVRVAVNRTYASIETKIADGDEIAFFPPVTGG